MNKLKCFFGFHEWMPISRGKGQMGKRGEAVICVNRCIHCGKETAFISSELGDKTVGLEYAKSVMDIK